MNIQQKIELVELKNTTDMTFREIAEYYGLGEAIATKYYYQTTEKIYRGSLELFIFIGENARAYNVLMSQKIDTLEKLLEYVKKNPITVQKPYGIGDNAYMDIMKRVWDYEKR